MILRYHRLLPLALILAFAVSLAFAVTHRPLDPALLSHDSVGYNRLAVQLLSEHTYGRATFWAPAYPAFLALVYSMAGISLLAVYVAQAALLAVALFFLYRIAFYVTEDERTALLAVALCLLWPPIWLTAGDVMTEILAAAVLAPALWYLTVSIRSPAVGRCVAAGVLIGIGALTKAVVLPFAVVAALMVALSGPGDRLRRIGWGAMVLAACVMVVAPWSIRNYRVSGAFVPVCSGGGYNFWIGNWPPMYTSRWEWNKFPPPLDRMLKGKSEVEVDRILMNDAVRYVRQDPLRAVGLCLRKFSSLWLGSLGADPRSAGNPIPHIRGFGIPKRSFFHVPLFVAAVAGWIMLSKTARARGKAMMALLITWTVLYSAIWALPRYAAPVTFYEILLAAIALRRVVALLRPRKTLTGGQAESV